MNNDFYLKAESTSNYWNRVKVLFIYYAHKLFFMFFLDWRFWFGFELINLLIEIVDGIVVVYLIIFSDICFVDAEIVIFASYNRVNFRSTFG